MKNTRLLVLSMFTLALTVQVLHAQGRQGQDGHRFRDDSSRYRRDGDSFPRRTDSSQHFNDSLRNPNDSTRPRNDSNGRRRNGFASLFADSSALTTSDYQLQIEKTYVILHNIETNSELGFGIARIKQRLADSDSILAVLKDNINNNSNALNLRNLQVFRTLLENVGAEARDHRQLLDSTEARLNNLKDDMKLLIGDTVMKQLFRDSVLRQQFAVQMKEMRGEWRSSTRQLKESLAEINFLQTQNSSSSITTSQLLEKLNSLISNSAARLFGKESNYLWEPDRDTLSSTVRSSVRKAYDGEQKALRYYFRGSNAKRLFLLVIGLLFFWWIFRNIRIMKRLGQLHKLDGLGFNYLPAGYILATLVVIFCIAPLFDLRAPAAYIEAMQFLLLIILTIVCWKKWPRKLFGSWLVMAVLYLCFSFTHHMIDPGFFQRCLFILLNVLSIVFGLYFLSRMKAVLPLRGFLRFVIVLHSLLNILAIVFNIFGRVSLAQILGNAAIFGFTQAIGLAVFSKIMMEAIVLQIVTSRVKRNTQSTAGYDEVIRSFGRPIFFLVIVLWLIVLATNLNVYTALLDGLIAFLRTPRQIGSAGFSLGGILLFFMIIWIAHLLQKYVGYFFGETGADEELQNKGARSRLLIARLVLLCLGYLLAVAASGVPVDKITIVLGALGVGIGLGLQNIVNNFVSGIILIFDRPLQIGDIVEVGGHNGKVREIGIRSSTLMTKDGAEVIIPNGDILSQQIVNWTLSNNQQRVGLDLSLTGNTDMEQVATAVKKTILQSKFIYESREPQVLFTAVKDNGFNLKVYYWTKDVARSEEARSEILLLLHSGLKEQGIVMG